MLALIGVLCLIAEVSKAQFPTNYTANALLAGRYNHLLHDSSYHEQLQNSQVWHMQLLQWNARIDSLQQAFAQKKTGNPMQLDTVFVRLRNQNSDDVYQWVRAHPKLANTLGAERLQIIYDLDRQGVYAYREQEKRRAWAQEVVNFMNQDVDFIEKEGMLFPFSAMKLGAHYRSMLLEEMELYKQGRWKSGESRLVLLLGSSRKHYYDDVLNMKVYFLRNKTEEQFFEHVISFIQ